MKKIFILMPVYNDWKSLIKLLEEIDLKIDNLKDFQFECLIVNDCSSLKIPKIIKPKNLVKLTLVNMNKNQGHARCNATGLRFINDKKEFDYVIVMDSDGEDRPIEILDMIEKIKKEPMTSVVAKRIKRSEGFFFRSLYNIHKFITFLLTGKNINFGNYSCLTKNDVNLIAQKSSLWSSFSGTIKKYVKKLNEINSTRGIRYFGPSKMSLINLILHSFSIIAVFKYTVLIRSTFLIIILSLLFKTLGLIVIFFQICIVIFNLLIFFISFRENKEKLLKSFEIIASEENVTQ